MEEICWYSNLPADIHCQIQQAALEAGMDTQAFCDMNCRTFEVCVRPHIAVKSILTCLCVEQALAKAANLDNDHFIRTTDPAHRDAVQYFWVGRSDDPRVHN